MARFPYAIACFVAAQLASNVAQAAINVACVGDSITQNSGWCEALGTKLGSSYKVTNFGVSGTTLLKAGDSPYWTSAQYTPSHDFAPNIVVIMLGTNDSKPQNWSKKASFVADYEALISSYTSLSSNPSVYINLPPPAGTNTYSISGTVIANEVIPMIRQVAANRQLPTIDIFAAFGGSSFDASLYGSAQDQVHPNAKGAQLICDAVYAALGASKPSGVGGASSGGASSGGASSGGAGKAGSGSFTSGGTAQGTNLGGGSAARPLSTGGTTGSGGKGGNTGQTLAGGTLNTVGTGGTQMANTGGSQSSGGTSTAVGQPVTGGSLNSSRLSSGGSTSIDSTLAGGAASTSSNASTGNQPNTTRQSARGGQSSVTSSVGGALANSTSAPAPNNVASNTPAESGCGCRMAQRRPRSSEWLFILCGAMALLRGNRTKSLRQAVRPIV